MKSTNPESNQQGDLPWGDARDCVEEIEDLPPRWHCSCTQGYLDA